ncbi:MAG: hypothetical protein ACRECV_10310 [Xanthobacteraceae bacterium]
MGHVEIDVRYASHARNARDGRPRRRFSFAARRVNELNLFFIARYGHTLPDDDAAAADIVLMLHHLARMPIAAPKQMHYWVKLRAPWMHPDEAEKLIGRVIAFPLKFRADTLGKRLGLTEVERSRLGIRTIGSIDMTAAERKQARRLRQRQRDRARRRDRGAKPRADWLQANSISREKPWEALGIKRRTWYRRRAAGAPTA